MPHVCVINNNDGDSVEIEYKLNKTLKEVVRESGANVKLYSHRLAVDNTVFKDWSLPIQNCLAYGQNIYFYKFRDTKSLDLEITIKQLNEEKTTFTLKINSSDQVRDLKNLIDAYIHAKPDEQSLVFDGKYLEDDQKLSEYGIKNNSEILLKPSVKGGSSGLVGNVFADISKEGKFIKLADEGPEWLQIDRGLNLFGLCENKRCEAYGKLVAMMMNGTNCFLLGMSGQKPTKCPICESHVDPITCGFYKCSFRFVGQKLTDDGKNTQIVISDWKDIRKDFYYFTRSEKAIWTLLCIETSALGLNCKRLTYEAKCNICLSEDDDNNSGFILGDCKHRLHKKCLDGLKVFKCEHCREAFKKYREANRKEKLCQVIKEMKDFSINVDTPDKSSSSSDKEFENILRSRHYLFNNLNL